VQHRYRFSASGNDPRQRYSALMTDERYASQMSPSFLRSFVVGLSQSDACSPAIFIDELDAGFFECLANDLKRRAARLVYSALKLTNRDNSHS
jgi:hypothetical protein